MKKQTKVTLIALSTTLFTFLYAADTTEANSTTHYETAHRYANNENVTKVLSIPGASALKVTIKGELEKSYDFVSIQGVTFEDNETRRFTGLIDESFTIPGDEVDMLFTSDSSITKNGFSVDVEPSNINNSSSHFETAHPYKDNTTSEEKILTIPGAEHLFVTIKGEVENHYDRILITEKSGKTGFYTGKLNEEFQVKGDSVTVQFISDGSTHKSGVTVDVTDKKIKVESIGNAEQYEGDKLTHHVTLNAIPTTPVELSFTIENNTTEDNDYEHGPIIPDEYKDYVTVSDDNKTLTVVDVKEFDLKIQSTKEGGSTEPDEFYNIIIGDENVTARGKIEMVGP